MTSIANGEDTNFIKQAYLKLKSLCSKDDEEKEGDAFDLISSKSQLQYDRIFMEM